MEQLFALVVGVCVVVIVVVVEANHSKHIFFTFHVAPIIFLICHWFGQCLQNKNEQNKDFILKRLFSLCFGFQFCAQQKFHSKQSLQHNIFVSLFIHTSKVHSGSYRHKLPISDLLLHTLSGANHRSNTADWHCCPFV
jgi:hypothetical protein